MTFLNPLVLLGLVAASVPLLLHLFNLRKLKTIEFSTLTFLKELQKTKIRRLKLRQILLLILRTLFIILVVFAFSRPTLKGALSGGFARTSAVFIIDDSYSMTGMDEHGELLKQAKQMALQAVDFLRDGDEVSLLRLSETNPSVSEEGVLPYRNFGELRSVINEVKPVYIHRKLDDALLVAGRLLSASTNFNKEVYVFSDFQSGVIANSRRHTETSRHVFPAGTRLFLASLGHREFQNASIDAVTIPNTIFEAGKPFSVIAKVTNHGPNKLTNVLVSVFATGTRVAQKGVSIESGKSFDVELSVVPKKPGIIEGMTALEDDDLDFDNHRYFTVTIPEEIHVLLVGSPSDVSYIKLALSAAAVNDSSGIKIVESSATAMAGTRLTWADVVILSNVRELAPLQQERLRTFANAGGGLMIFPGSATAPSAFNSTFGPLLRLPRMLSIEGNGRTQSQSFLEIEKTDMRHPLFAGMFENLSDRREVHGAQTPTKTLESPRVRTFAKFDKTSEALPVISLSDGNPFLLDQKTGAGRVLMFSVAANLEWSDFPLKGLFVPLLHRSVSYLGQHQSQMESALAGDEVILNNIRDPAMKFTLQDPHGSEFVIPVSLRGSEKSLFVSETSLPGTYLVKSGKEVVRAFAVNVDPDEAKTAKTDLERLKTMMMNLGADFSAVHTIEDAANLGRAIAESRYGVELWKYFLISALLIALVEMFVARDARKELLELKGGKNS